jgi:MFS family permease
MKRESKLLIAADSAFIIGTSLYGPIYAIFVEKIGGAILDVGIAYFIFLITMATLEIPAAKLADKYGRKKFLLAAYLLIAMTVLGYIFVENKYQLFLLQFLGGIALAFGDPAWDGWFSSSIDKKESSFGWGLFHCVEGYGTAIAALAGGAIAQFIGFKTLFLVSGIIALFGFIITLGIKEKEYSERKFVHKRRFFRKRRIRIKNHIRH